MRSRPQHAGYEDEFRARRSSTGFRLADRGWLQSLCFLLIQVTSFGCGFDSVGASTKAVVLENALFRYTISPGSRNVAFIDRATGTDYLRTNAPSQMAEVRIGSRTYQASTAAFENQKLTLSFGETGVKVVLRAETRDSCVVLAVESIAGGEVDALTFLNVRLTLQGAPNEPFGACALSLNLATRVDALPALQRELRASCEKKFGIVGAKAAIVGAPMSRMLPALQETLATANELPVCKVAGPWAREIPFNYGSYLFNFGSLTETNVEDWIEMTRRVGFTQIDNHGGGAFFRFGDFELNRKKWPEGWESFRRIVARLHAAGIGSIFHSYAFFIDKNSKYVTPVPDSRLDAFRTFTLAAPLSAEAKEILVNESTAGISTVTGFFEHNSVVLHIDNELVTFSGASKEAPWKFTGVTRGAFGTRAGAHDRGAKARHLKECFGLFVPDVGSSLFEEIAANHADVVNRCGFDGLYLDAIDGSSILRGGDEAWYWAAKFVVEIQKRLKKPAGMEMSAMWHHFWQYRTRWQAWDYPQRGHKRFVEFHAAEVNGGMLLPLHLGWWGFQSFNPPQVEPVFPDVMENVGAKLVGWEAGISLTAGVDRKSLEDTPLFGRAVDILRTCEELRRAHAVDERVKTKLREPGSEFVLFKDVSGKHRFRREQSQSQTVALGEPWSLSWQITNAFSAQPARFRIEALMSASGLEDTNALIVADLAETNSASWQSSHADGVSFTLRPFPDRNGSAAELIATNSGKVPPNAAWARLEKRFDPPINLNDRQGLGVEIEGDSSSALVAVRLESPRHLAFGALADRYVPVDFTGRRSLTLVETESTRWSDYVWNDGKSLYNAYRETINFGVVDSVSVWLQNLPAGRDTKVRLGAIRALPLRPVSVKNPKLTIGGQTLEFSVELSSGSWLECNGPEDCAVYGPKGQPLGKISPRGQWPSLPTGVATLSFSCESDGAHLPRARIVTFTLGPEL